MDKNANCCGSKVLKVIRVESIKGKFDRDKMIIILEKCKLLLKFIGLGALDVRANILLRITFSVLFTSGLAFASIFIILNFGDHRERAISGIPPFCGFLIVYAIYLHLLINRDRFCAVINELQNIVNESS